MNSPWPDEADLEISPASVSSLLNSQTPFRLVDVRELDEWHLCKIQGAELFPLSSFAESAPRLLNDPDSHVVIYCHHGRRSAHATEWLRHHGHHKVWSMAGGIESWATDIDPATPRY
jgi:adenylyltransferase/sulfurtransferase